MRGLRRGRGLGLGLWGEWGHGFIERSHHARPRYTTIAVASASASATSACLVRAARSIALVGRCRLTR